MRSIPGVARRSAALFAFDGAIDIEQVSGSCTASSAIGSTQPARCGHGPRGARRHWLILGHLAMNEADPTLLSWTMPHWSGCDTRCHPAPLCNGASRRRKFARLTAFCAAKISTLNSPPIRKAADRHWHSRHSLACSPALGGTPRVDQPLVISSRLPQSDNHFSCSDSPNNPPDACAASKVRHSESCQRY